MSDYVIKKAVPGGSRCLATLTTGAQCPNAPLENCTMCVMHGGNRQIISQQNAGLKNLRLTNWLARLTIDHVNSPEIKSLRDEIGILRILLEEKLAQCENSFDLITHTPAIVDLIMKIEVIVSRCHKLEESMGKLLDEDTLMQFAGEVVQIITAEVEDAELVGRIGKKILASHKRIMERHEEDDDD